MCDFACTLFALIPFVCFQYIGGTQPALLMFVNFSFIRLMAFIRFLDLFVIRLISVFFRATEVR